MNEELYCIECKKSMKIVKETDHSDDGDGVHFKTTCHLSCGHQKRVTWHVGNMRNDVPDSWLARD